MLQKLPETGNSVAEDLDRSVPTTHDLGRFQTVMNNLMGSRMIQSGAQLASDIEQVPDRESFVARQHGRNAISLDVFHRRAELAINDARADHRAEIRTAQDLDALHLLHQGLLESSGMLSKRA